MIDKITHKKALKACVPLTPGTMKTGGVNTNHVTPKPPPPEPMKPKYLQGHRGDFHIGVDFSKGKDRTCIVMFHDPLQLKKCPFCYKVAVMLSCNEQYGIQCTNYEGECPASSLQPMYKSIREAENKWNLRADEVLPCKDDSSESQCL